MNPTINRRDFLKIAGLFSVGHLLPSRLTSILNTEVTSHPNILIILFDAWSAANTSLYGYPRKTTPNLEKLANKAIVYHNHIAGGHFTIPGVTSLLTGTTTWTNHAFNFSHKFSDPFLKRNLFGTINHYHRSAYTHNPLADSLLRQLSSEIDNFTPWDELYLESDTILNALFSNDRDVASIAWNRALKQMGKGYSYSLYLAHLYKTYKSRFIKKAEALFPLGLPNHDDTAFFTLEQGIDWAAKQVIASSEPFLGYYHFFPPHDPYHPRADFVDAFAEDEYIPQTKPLHFLHKGVGYSGWALEQRQRYDEFMLYMDAEFARLYEMLQQSGVLDNTWVILTSDHGEMFERGIIGHTTPVFYQPIIHVPLLIFPPGQKERVDIHQATSATDLLPTLLHVTGLNIPEWVEGEILPPFQESPSREAREISTIQIEDVDDAGEIRAATAMSIKNNFKLIWYFGYDEIQGENQFIELFDLANDYEELQNLYPEHKLLGDEMLAQLQTRLQETAKAFRQ